MKTTKPIVFITGQSGLVGKALTKYLTKTYHVHGLQRMNSLANNPSWNYRQSLSDLDIKAPKALIHLAGAGIADKRWYPKYKQTIYDSRINGSRWLADEILIHEHLPEVFLSASAIGYYGHRPGELLDEASSSGNNYVAKIADNWEKATLKLSTQGVRVVNMRFGMILSKTGGALKEMLLPFKLGLGGRVGDGQQTYSWVAIQDVTNAIEFLLQNKTLNGPINITSPNAVSNKTFTKALASALNRPAFMHMPKSLVRLIFGEVADELLLANTHVRPQRLLTAGYRFQEPDLKPYLNNLLS